MKLRNLFIAAAGTMVIFACGTNENKETTADASGPEAIYVLNADASNLNWKGTMLGVKEHTGTVKLTEGNITVKGNAVTAGTFTADLKSINPTDANYNEQYTKEMLVGHLQTAEFFAVDSFPTAKFVVKSFDGNTLTGDLTVRGRTNEEKVTDVVVTNEGDAIKATGKLVFNRQKYGVSWMNPAKDMVLSDDIEINVELSGSKQ
ncbi:MAG: YceI family protein [Cytophagaceae bacterium]